MKSSMGPKLCQVCTENQSKYKCPSCLVPYCSLVCFKKHKETPCSKPESVEKKSIQNMDLRPSPHEVEDAPVGQGATVAAPELPVEKQLNINEPSEVLQKLQLESIASSSEIRDALKDESLQKLIYDIDCSPDAENELEKAMGVEVFRIFTDKVLSAIGP